MAETALTAAIWTALGGDAADLVRLRFTGTGALPAVFAVTDLAAASIGVAGLALAGLIAGDGAPWPEVTVDRRLASFWFGTTIRPDGWQPPPLWGTVAGDYATADGWIRLHTNAPVHEAAALRVLGVGAGRSAVVAAVAGWQADALEAAVLAAGGCAATMRSAEAWTRHPQGHAVAAEPLVHWTEFGAEAAPSWRLAPARPLRGIRVLDLTRVLAGPAATRFLAGFGAEVARIDPPFWDEPALAPEMTLGKRCAHLDLRRPEDLATMKRLIAAADVLIHGYRPGALAGFGLDEAARRALNPALIDVSLDAYGWTGPWRGRRGFDSLVQMSTGIAAVGMRRPGQEGPARERPTPLPVQALDHATGYIMAAAALRGLAQRRATGRGFAARASLARTAALLMGQPQAETAALEPESPHDWAETAEQTAWGPARRLKPPLRIGGSAMRWDVAAGPLGLARPPLWR